MKNSNFGNKFEFSRKYEVKLKRLEVPPGSEKAYIVHNIVLWDDGVESTHSKPHLTNTSKSTLVEPVLNNIPIKKEMLENENEDFFQLRIKEEPMYSADEDDEVQILFSSVRVFYTNQ